jgi:predicted ribosomally synthesized peptide with SipW-like signal peptide
MKNKKSLIAAGAIALIAIAGGTFAYFRYTETFENNFGLAKEEVSFTETFKSPDN